MKLSKLKFTAVAAAAALVLTTAASQAAITYVPGDLLLGFRSTTNSTIDYVFDLGAASAYKNATTPFTITLTGLSSAIGGSYGSVTGANVRFALFAADGSTATNQNNDPRRTIYLSEPTGTVAASESTNSGFQASIVTVENYYRDNGGNGPTTNSATGSPGDSGSFSTNVQTGFANGNFLPVEGAVGGGLDLYRLPETAAGSASKLGNFTYSGGDNFTFTAVPEPSTAALGGLVVLGLAFRRQRKSMLS